VAECEASFEVEFARSGVTITVPPGVAVVDAAANGVMFPCVSRASSGRLVLDC
jgi:hypothetical protein